MQDCVLIFDYNRYPFDLKNDAMFISHTKFPYCNSFCMMVIIFSPGGQAFIESLLPRLNPKNMNGVPAMPFELEVSDSC